MKKIIWLLFCVMFFTGCTVEYNLTISNDTINENISISTRSSSGYSFYFGDAARHSFTEVRSTL